MKINAKALCWTALAYLAAASGSNAQVLFGNAYGSVNAGSHPVGSPAPSIPLPFTIGAGTKVVGVRVLTTGVTGRDFLEAKESTCGVGTYSTEEKCLVNVIFKPVASGLRRGAVVFTFRYDTGDTLLTTTLPIYGIGLGPELVFGPGGAKANMGGKFVSPEGVTVDAAGKCTSRIPLSRKSLKSNREAALRPA